MSGFGSGRVHWPTGRILGVATLQLTIAAAALGERAIILRKIIFRE